MQDYNDLIMSELTIEKIFKNYPIDVKEVAEALDVSPVTVYRWRSGERTIGTAHLKLLNQYIREKYGKTMEPIKGHGGTLPGRINLRAFRRAHRLAQKDIADMLGKSQSWVSQIENGQGDMTPEEERNLISAWPDADRFRREEAEAEEVTIEFILREQVRLLQERIKDKDEIIELLKKDKGIIEETNKYLRDRIDFPGESDSGENESGKVG